MKTAISIPDDIFEEIEELSKELRCSRSRILTDAAREYIEKMKNRKIFEALNEVYAEKETKQESRVRKMGKRRYAKAVKKEKW